MQGQEPDEAIFQGFIDIRLTIDGRLRMLVSDRPKILPQRRVRPLARGQGVGQPRLRTPAATASGARVGSLTTRLVQQG